jgi:homogentisate phytyltransferase/homogentisate geranylgeranyltransferase
VGLFLLAGGLQGSLLPSLPLLLLTLISSLAANIYIVGLNQLADVQIDRINKPYLPLASGEYTLGQGRWIVTGMGVLSIGLALSQGWFLFLTVAAAILIGTLYSLPPLHLKQRPVWAALSIAFVRGLVTNFGLFLHFHQHLSPETPIPWLLVAGLAVFFFGFGLVIALYKDIPDLIGDRRYGIRTFTVRIGPERVFRAGRWILTGFYLALTALGLVLLPGIGGILLMAAHLLILAFFWSRSGRVEPAKPASITRFYMFLWSLFYAEYIILGLGAILVPAWPVAI